MLISFWSLNSMLQSPHTLINSKYDILYKCLEQQNALWDPHSVRAPPPPCLISAPAAHKCTPPPRLACLFQIIPSDKINASVYEVIALMGHTPLRWHSVLHSLNMTPIADCALSQVCLPFFSLPLRSSLSVLGPRRLYSGTDRLGVRRMPLCRELTLSWEPPKRI